MEKQLTVSEFIDPDFTIIDPQLAIILFAVWLTMIIPPLIIYWDAQKHKIGKVENDDSFWNVSAERWGVYAFLFWIVAYAKYFANRKKLIEIAQTSPHESNYKFAKLVALAAFEIAVTTLL